jgi:hypothetical protein
MFLEEGLRQSGEGATRRRALADANMKLSTRVEGLLGYGEVERPRGARMMGYCRDVWPLATTVTGAALLLQIQLANV